MAWKAEAEAYATTESADYLRSLTITHTEVIWCQEVVAGKSVVPSAFGCSVWLCRLRRDGSGRPSLGPARCILRKCVPCSVTAGQSCTLMWPCDGAVQSLTSIVLTFKTASMQPSLALCTLRGAATRVAIGPKGVDFFELCLNWQGLQADGPGLFMATLCWEGFVAADTSGTLWMVHTTLKCICQVPLLTRISKEGREAALMQASGSSVYIVVDKEVCVIDINRCCVLIHSPLPGPALDITSTDENNPCVLTTKGFYDLTLDSCLLQDHCPQQPRIPCELHSQKEDPKNGSGKNSAHTTGSLFKDIINLEPISAVLCPEHFTSTLWQVLKIYMGDDNKLHSSCCAQVWWLLLSLTPATRSLSFELVCKALFYTNPDLILPFVSLMQRKLKNSPTIVRNNEILYKRTMAALPAEGGSCVHWLLTQLELHSGHPQKIVKALWRLISCGDLRHAIVVAKETTKQRPNEKSKFFAVFLEAFTRIRGLDSHLGEICALCPMDLSVLEVVQELIWHSEIAQLSDECPFPCRAGELRMRAARPLLHKLLCRHRTRVYHYTSAAWDCLENTMKQSAATTSTT
uniref:uncharacterized protein n=1 Tax=Myxine glutinosa TaxID=7769 RepID=UPI00358FF3C4